jgi:hypothetical protein
LTKVFCCFFSKKKTFLFFHGRPSGGPVPEIWQPAAATFTKVNQKSVFFSLSFYATEVCFFIALYCRWSGARESRQKEWSDLFFKKTSKKLLLVAFSERSRNRIKVFRAAAGPRSVSGM